MTPSGTTGRRVTWAEGNANDGIVLYLDGAMLHGHAWSTRWPS